MQLTYPSHLHCPADGAEYFPIVTPEGIVTGCLPRAICHNGSKPLHPVVHLHIFNKKGELYLQKRSMSKDIQPGKWDTAVGGHIDFGESIYEALLREANEELGLTDIRPEWLFSYPFESEIEKELVNTYSIYAEGPFQSDPVEIDEGRFWPIEEIRANLAKGVFTPNFEGEFERLCVLFSKSR
ncbi:MAG: NUDIX domain-containing protein [Bacteroidales bacterium]